MTFIRTMHRLRASLMALFLVAQVAGVVPLIYDHTLNLFERSPVPAHSHVHLASSLAAPDADHHHGALDLHDQCCALHTLAAPLPYTPNPDPQELVGRRIILAVAVSLPQSRPALPDRPPRPLPLM
jgi:hypothetical protein